jgi:hypothetical protein
MQGKSFNWTDAATPQAINILSQIFAGMKLDIPNSNLVEWMDDLLKTEIGKKHADDLKHIKRLFGGKPPPRFIPLGTTHEDGGKITPK